MSGRSSAAASARRLCLAGASLLLLLASCRPAPTPRTPQSPPAATQRRAAALLESDQVTDIEVIAGTEWRAGLAVVTDSYLQLAVEQRDIDVIVGLVDSAGGSLAAVDGAAGIGVDERAAFRLSPGRYEVVLTPRAGGPKEGVARLKIEALRPFATGDDERMRLIRLGHEATHLDGSHSDLDWRRSYELSIEELAGWRQLGDTAGIVRTLNRMTSLEREFGELAASIRHGEEAVRLSVSTAADVDEASSRYWLAQTLARTGDPDAAASEFELGLAAAERAGDLALQGRILNWQGRLQDSLGNALEARELYRRALDLRRQAHDTRGISSILNNLALIAETLGEISQAIELFRESIAEANLLDTPSAALLPLSNLSSLLAARGQWQEALESLSSGLEVARAENDPRNESYLGTNLAQLLLTLGEPSPARALLQRSLELDRTREDGFSEAKVLLNLAELELGLGNLQESEKWVLQAYDVSLRKKLETQKDQAVRHLASLRLEQERPQAALDLLIPALDEAKRSNQPILQAKLRRALGEAHLAMDDPAAALEDVELALEVLDDLAAPEIRFGISYLTARAKHAQGDLMAAVEAVEGALRMIESLRLSVEDPDLRATFLARGRETYDFAVSRFLDLDRQQPGEGFDRRAFLTLERARARSLSEMLARARAGAERALDPGLLEAERTALAQVTRLGKRVGQAAQGGEIEELGRLQPELEDARRRLTAAEDALRVAAPGYASLRYADSYPVAELQELLDPGVALVEFRLQSDRSVAFVVTRDRFEVVELAAEELIRDRARALRATLITPSRRAFGALQSRARQLGALLIEPLAQSLAESRRLIIVPDGDLAYIPFEALRLRPQGSGEDIFLIERWVVSYSPSAGVFRSLRRDSEQASRGDGLVAFADPRPPERTAISPQWPRLPGAREEVASIAEVLGTRGTLTFTDAAADERTLKTEPAVGRARWIHLAAHAWIDEAAPANSAIVLAAVEGEDGYLTVEEILALELDADLVILSGCETALGRQIRGEGLVGLTRGFLYAGARGMQVSLWKVADETTPALMSSFYANLARNVDAAEALHAAKLASLADPRRSHPFYWAPFVLLGG